VLAAFVPDSVNWEDLHWAEAVQSVYRRATRKATHPVRPGRVLRTHRVGFDALTPQGREFVIHQARRRDPLTAPATGDWVAIGDLPDVEDPVITTVLPRVTALVRRDPADRAAPQVLAAGIDVVAVVQGADRPVNARRLERQLALAHGSGAEVLVVVTKTDLAGAEEVLAGVRAAAPAEQVLVTAAGTDPGNDSEVGIDALIAMTSQGQSGRTVALLGESGAGKSTLVNAVLGHEALATGGVRGGDAKGRHTTTRRELLILPLGGGLLDTPGVRAIALWPGYANLEAVFTEVAAAAQECRFGDCTHDTEPGCAVGAAVAAGAIDAERLDAWRQLTEELEATRAQIEQKDWR
jgi:ribosome biogenesis GTPase